MRLVAVKSIPMYILQFQMLQVGMEDSVHYPEGVEVGKEHADAEADEFG